MLARKLIAAVLVILQLGACATVKTAPREADAARKSFASTDGLASVYVYSDEYWGIAFANVAVDGSPLGQIGTRSYLHVELAPGRHSISAQADNTATVEFDADPGGVYFIAQRRRPGWGLLPSIKLEAVADEEGRKGVLASNLAVATYTEEDLGKVKAVKIGGLVMLLVPVIAAAIVLPQIGAAVVMSGGMK